MMGVIFDFDLSFLIVVEDFHLKIGKVVVELIYSIKI